jgi:thiol-disulfide isomerase/thioredoxin
MKKLILITTFLCFSTFTFSQAPNEKGIQFEKNSSWEQIVAKAQKENKHIFVDCFTTWCGPCKMLDKGAFASEKTGEFFAKNFVSLKLQMNKTAQDVDYVKNNYALSEKFAKDYLVRAYPTMLIFNPKGELVHRIVGGGNIEDTQLLEQVNAGLSTETQSTYLKKKYEKGEKSPEFLRVFAASLINTYDDFVLTNKVCKQLLETQQNWSLKENLQFVCYYPWQSSSKEFQYIQSHQQDFDDYLKTNFRMSAKKFVNRIIGGDCFDQSMDSKTQKVDYEKLDINLRKVMSKEDARLAVVNFKIYDLLKEKIFNDEYVRLINELTSLDKEISAMELNQYAWDFFEKSDNKELLKKALNWAMQSVEKSSEPYNNDTVANLLFKIGDDMSSAKIYAEKAIFLAEQIKGDTDVTKELLVKINARLEK